jgi:REP element-mobilizing transposase RayT
VPEQSDDATVRHRGYLPHWERRGATYFVTFRLADALPESIVERFRSEREMMELRLNRGQRQPKAAERAQMEMVLARKIERYLDGGSGACHLRIPAIAALVSDALRAFDGTRYRLACWCVMPNHVHVIVEPLAGFALARIVHSWKSYTAHEANRRLSRAGAFWQREYYDHLIRDERAFLRIVRYVMENPAKANLVNWAWMYLSEEVGIAGQET